MKRRVQLTLETRTSDMKDPELWDIDEGWEFVFMCVFCDSKG